MSKILLDATTLLSEKSGVGFYTKKIADALMSKQNDFAPYFHLNNYFSENINKNGTKTSTINRILFKSIDLKYFIISKNIRNFIKKKNIKLFHQPNFITYDTGIISISTIHDLAFLYYPNFFLKDENYFFEKFFEKNLKLNSKIIVHSNTVKKELNRYFNFPTKNIEVIYEDLRYPFKVLEKEKCKNFLAKYNLKYKKFFLVLGTLELRKNHEAIINIYKKLNDNVKSNYPLIIAGMKGRYAEKILDTIKYTKNCYYIDYLDEKLLNECYSSAKILFYPSIYEGFGIPPLESMACGTPPMVSNLEVFNEIMQDSCIALDLQNEDIWIEKINELLNSEELYQIYVQRGLKKSRNFKKGNTIRKILDLYSKLF